MLKGCTSFKPGSKTGETLDIDGVFFFIDRALNKGEHLISGVEDRINSCELKVLNAVRLFSPESLW